MSNYLIDLLPLTLVLLLFYKARPVKPLSAFNEAYLDMAPCCSLRGFLAVFVIFHHLSQQTVDGRIMPMLSYFGNLPVSVFFFISGYGLMKKYLSDKNYAAGFLARRIPPLLLPFFSVLLMFFCFYRLSGEKVSLMEPLIRIFAADPILVILWYMLVIMVFYLVFGLMMQLCSGRKKLLIIGMTLFCSAFILLGHLLHVGQWWYNTCHLLIIGMVWALYEEALLSFIKRFYWPCLLLTGFVFIFLWQYFDALYALRPSPETKLVISLVRNSAFTLAFVLFCMKIRLQNPVLDFLGKISMELYMLHPFFLAFFHSSFIHLENDFAYCISVLACTVLFAKALSMPYKAACKKYYSLLK